ncbi:MAG: CSLREA domain-containing protein [Bifidobacteriaceae bacterium]|nr:CSLREA domain-containing protein [Bifidobacteriaceae bacterium]
MSLTLGMLVTAVGGTALSPQAAADTPVSFVVDTAVDGADADPGNGYCGTSHGLCTLRAAIMEANADRTNTTVEITVKEGVSGRIDLPNAEANLMFNTAVSSRDKGAYLYVDRPMTIDLGGRLGLGALTRWSYDRFWIAGLYVNAANVVLKNFSNFFATDSSIVFGPDSDGSQLIADSLTKGSNVQAVNSHGNRFAALLSGADNIRIEGMRIGRLANDSDDQALDLENGAIVVGLGGPATDAGTDDGANVVRDLTISNVTIDNSPVGTNPVCDLTDQGGRGCASNGIAFAADVEVHDLTVQDSTLRHFPSMGARPTTTAINAASVPAASDWNILGNVFEQVKSGLAEEQATLVLPPCNITGTSQVTDNKFVNGTAADVQGVAIYWGNPTGTYTPASDMSIEDNLFNGYRKLSAPLVATVSIARPQSVTVRRNEFGPVNNGRWVTAEEETGSDNVMFANLAGANPQVQMWIPTGDEWQQVGQTGDQELMIYVEPVQSQPAPLTPVDLDFYAATSSAAPWAVEYIGTVSGVTAAGWVELPGEATGDYIRLQTHYRNPLTAQVESSQYSRFWELPQELAAGLEIDLQAWVDLPGGCDTWGEIKAAPGSENVCQGIQELEEPMGNRPLIITAGQEVWFTYTVKNTTSQMIIMLGTWEFKDTYGAPPCALEVDTDPYLMPGETGGCLRKATELAALGP